MYKAALTLTYATMWWVFIVLYWTEEVEELHPRCYKKPYTLCQATSLFVSLTPTIPIHPDSKDFYKILQDYQVTTSSYQKHDNKTQNIYLIIQAIGNTGKLHSRIRGVFQQKIFDHLTNQRRSCLFLFSETILIMSLLAFRG